MSRAADAPTRWWWVRHAPVTSHAGTLYGALDVPCDTSDGDSFAALAARLPEGAQWVVSALGRTRATAAALAAAAGTPLPPLRIEAALNEQDFGAWHGRRWDALGRDGPAAAAFWADPAQATPPGGESFADVLDRVAAVIERLGREFPGRDVVAIAHGGTIRAACAHALGLAPGRALGLCIDPLSLTRLDHVPGRGVEGGGSGWRAVWINRPVVC